METTHQVEHEPRSLPTTRTFITNILSSLNPPIVSSNDTSASQVPTQNASDPTHPPKEQPTNPLKNLTANQKALLMTLHILFPNELLPALDLLDRALITQFTTTSPSPPPNETSTTDPPPPTPTISAKTNNTRETAPDTATAAHEHGRRAAAGIYYVRSAQHANANSKRHRDPLASSTHYEVRTTGWSCSCPAFAFSAFPASSSSSSSYSSSLASEQPAEVRARGRREGEGGGGCEGGDIGEFGSRGREIWGVGGLALGEGVPVCKHLLACALVEGAGPLFGGFVRREEVGVEEQAGWAAGWGG